MYRRILTKATYRIIELEESSPLYFMREDFLHCKIIPTAKEDFTTPARKGNFISLEARVTSGPHRNKTLQLIGVRIHKLRVQATCNCGAYLYPHKPGVGKCTQSKEKRNEVSNQS